MSRAHKSRFRNGRRVSKKSVEPQHEELRCPVCGSTNVFKDHSRGEWVCRDCGYVIKEFTVDPRGEFVDFSKPQTIRTGPPTSILFDDKGLSTNIGNANKNVKGLMRQKINILRKIHKYVTHDSRTRNRREALYYLKKYSNELALPHYLQVEAMSIYDKVLEQNKVKGRSIEHLVLASIYIAAKLTKYPLMIDEIIKVANIKKKDLTSTYRIIMRELNIPPNYLIVSPEIYVDRIVDKFNEKYKDQKGIFDKDVKRLAKRIVVEAKNLGLTSGKKPISIAAAALYVAAEKLGKEVVQSHLAKVSMITEVTIRNRQKEFLEKINIDELMEELGIEPPKKNH